MWIKSKQLLFGAAVIGVVAYLHGRRHGAEQEARLRGELASARGERDRARLRVNELEAARSQLILEQRASEAARVQAQGRVEQLERQLQTARERALTAESEITRLLEVATKQGLKLKPVTA